MRATLAKDLAEKDARARDNRRFTQGRVAAVNRLSHTVRVSVNESQWLEDVPYTAQTPPNVGDIGDLVYSGSSNHSVRFTNPRVSSGHGPGDVVLVGGVTSVQVPASGQPRLKGDVTYSAGANVTLNQTGQDIEISSTASGIAIGNTVGGGTAGRLLLEGAGPVLADDASLTWDSTNKALTVQSADYSVSKSIYTKETTTHTNDSFSGISIERVSSGTIAAGFGTGISFSVGTNSGAPLQWGAITAEHNGSATRSALVFRTHYDGDNAPVLYLHTRGDLQFTPKSGSGGFGLQLANVTSASVTSPLTGAMIWDAAVKVYNGAAWITLGTGSSGVSIGDTLGGGTPSRVLFEGAGSPATLADDASLTWDSTNKLFTVAGNVALSPATGKYGLRLANITEASISGHQKGELFYDTVLDRPKFYDGTFVRVVADICEVEIFNPGAAAYSITTPVALQELLNATLHRTMMDMSRFTQARVLVSRPAGGGAYTGQPIFGLQWCATNGGTFAYVNGGSGPVCQSPAAGGVTAGGWATITAAAKGDNILRIITLDTLGPDTFNIGRIIVQFQ